MYLKSGYYCLIVCTILHELQAKLEKVNHEFMEARQLYATYGSPVQEQKNGQ